MLETAIVNQGGACTIVELDLGLTFVGPDVAHLDLFGDKARSRAAR